MAAAKTISPTQAFSIGRDVFLKNWQPVVKLAVVLFVINIVFGMVIGLIAGEESAISSLLSFAANLLSAYLGYGFVKAMFMIYDKKPVDIQTLAQPVEEAARYIIGTFLFSLAVSFGMLFFIAPGFYIASKYFFVPALLVDEHASIGQAFSGSSKMTEGRKMDMFLYIVLSAIGVVIGLLAFIVGAFAVGWMAMFGMIALHRSLVAKAK